MFRWVFCGWFKGISQLLQGCFKDISRVFLEGFKCIHVVLQVQKFYDLFVKKGLVLCKEVISVTQANSIGKLALGTPLALSLHTPELHWHSPEIILKYP